MDHTPTGPKMVINISKSNSAENNVVQHANQNTLLIADKEKSVQDEYPDDSSEKSNSYASSQKWA